MNPRRVSGNETLPGGNLQEFDVVVVGGGAGGLAAAQYANRKNKRVVLISDSPLGGDCTFSGCVPSKSLIERIRRGDSFEIALTKTQEVIALIAGTESTSVMESKGIAVIEGTAAFTSPTSVEVDGKTITAPVFIIATGSSPTMPKIPGLDPDKVRTNETFFEPRPMPTSIAIIGGGAIGCELAFACARAGITTHIIEAESRLLGREDPEAASLVLKSLQGLGAQVHLGIGVTSIERPPRARNHRLNLSSGEEISVAEILVSAGRAPTTSELNLARANVETDLRGNIVVNSYLQTSTSGIFAVGDVTGKFALTHVADEMGRLAVRNALLPKLRWSKFSTTAIPSVIFSEPEIARVGISEAEATSMGARVAYLPYSEVDRAMIAGETDGFVKLFAGPNPAIGNIGGGKLLGASICGVGAGEMIHEAVLAMDASMFVGRIAQSVHAYPTWSTALRQTAAQFFHEVGGRSAEKSSPR